MPVMSAVLGFIAWGPFIEAFPSVRKRLRARTARDDGGKGVASSAPGAHAMASRAPVDGAVIRRAAAVPGTPEKKASITANTLANFAGRGWAILLNLALVPVYLRMLGAEAYGLVAFSATLNGLCSLLDLGLTTTINRSSRRARAIRPRSRMLERSSGRSSSSIGRLAPSSPSWCWRARS